MPSTLTNWEHWFLADWHWAGVLGAIALLLLFGVVVVVVDDNGDWWVF